MRFDGTGSFEIDNDVAACADHASVRLIEYRRNFCPDCATTASLVGPRCCSRVGMCCDSEWFKTVCKTSIYLVFSIVHLEEEQLQPILNPKVLWEIRVIRATVRE